MRIQYIYKSIGRKIAGSRLKAVAQMLRLSGIDIEADTWVGFNTVFSVLLSLTIALLLLAFNLDKIFVLLGLFSTFIVYHIVTYLFLMVASDSRAKFVENILPDFLSLMAVNIRSGMSVESAFMRSDRPEFGIFSESIKRASRKILAGEPIEAALIELKKDYRSPLLDSVVSTIIEGSQLGGELSSLLEMLAMDIRSEQMLKKEIAASILTYAAFIFMAACIAAPVLLAVVTKLAFIMSSVSEQVGAEVTSVPVGTGRSLQIGFRFNVDILKYFAVVTISTISGFASLIVGVIRSGSERAGIKYLPIFLFFSLGIYLLTSKILDMILAGIL